MSSQIRFSQVPKPIAQRSVICATLTLVICTFHREEFVLRSLSGLVRAGLLGGDIEVLVIDNSGGESLAE